MIEAIIFIAIGAALVVAYQSFSGAEKTCDRMIARNDKILKTLRSIKRDLQRQ